jgi:ribonuclease HI
MGVLEALVRVPDAADATLLTDSTLVTEATEAALMRKLVEVRPVSMTAFGHLAVQIVDQIPGMLELHSKVEDFRRFIRY